MSQEQQNGCGCHIANDSFPNITTFASCGQNKFQGASEEPRTADAKMDFIYPPVVFPSNKILKAMGAEKIKAMVLHHHSLLRKSSVGDLFPKDDAMFLAGTEKTAEFFIEALGGGDIFSSKHGHPALRQRHFQFTIDEKGREIWLIMYKKTLKDIDFPKEYIEEFWNWIEPLSIRMINRRTTTVAPERIYFDSIRAEFGL